MGDQVSYSNYIITKKTQAVITNDSYYRSKILEDKKVYYSVNKPEKIIANSCMINRSTMEGRMDAVKKILGTNSKIPIPVIPDLGVYMVPTTSIRNNNCIWLSYYQIKYYKQRDGQIVVVFYDGTAIEINISKSTFDMQLKKTSQIIAHYHREVIFE